MPVDPLRAMAQLVGKSSNLNLVVVITARTNLSIHYSRRSTSSIHYFCSLVTRLSPLRNNLSSRVRRGKSLDHVLDMVSN